MTLHQELKDATDSHHRKLEKDLNLLRSDLTIEDYVAILKRFYGFYRPLEERFSIPDDRKKVHLLEKDLGFFGFHNLDSLPTFDSFPEITHASFEMGMMYVIEGSTLGGTVLTKHFKEKLNLSNEGVQFFNSYGDKTFPLWRNFLNTLDSFSHSKDCDLHEAREGAVFTFRALQDWLINQ